MYQWAELSVERFLSVDCLSGPLDEISNESFETVNYYLLLFISHVIIQQIQK